MSPLSVEPVKRDLLNYKNIVFYGICLFLIVFSFIYNAPCNYLAFNSDHAIHVLMAEDFTFPRDYYYWGQNRLGSLLPFLTSLFHKIIPVHHLYLISIVHYLMLFTGFIILSARIKDIFLKIALCALIFFPVNDYNALILIGHPYSSQFFAGALFIYFLALMRKFVLRWTVFRYKQFLIMLPLSLGVGLSFYAGIWVSEFNALLLIIPLYCLIFDKNLKKTLLAGLRKLWILLSGTFLLICMVFAYILYSQVKSQFFDAFGYDSFFIDNFSDLQKNFEFFLDDLKATLFFQNEATLENSFNWFIILFTAFLLTCRIAMRKGIDFKNSFFINSLFIAALLSTILLFFSSWNLRQEFCPRYFTPVYIIYCFGLLLIVDRYFSIKYLRRFVSLVFIFFSICYCYNVNISKHSKGPFGHYNEYSNLPKGTLIGDYWDVYKINAVALHNLQSLPFDSVYVRNWDWRDVPLGETNFYFLNRNGDAGLPDTIKQHSKVFKYSGIKYYCNGMEIMQYYKLEIKYYIQSIFSGNYWMVNQTDHKVYATEADMTKAEEFELVELDKGKIAIKASNGKFISAERGMGDCLIADRDHAYEWETFELINTGDSCTYIISSRGTYVCADPFVDNLLVANRTEAREWEKFRLILKKSPFPK